MIDLNNPNQLKREMKLMRHIESALSLSQTKCFLSNIMNSIFSISVSSRCILAINDGQLYKVIAVPITRATGMANVDKFIEAILIDIHTLQAQIDRDDMCRCGISRAYIWKDNAIVLHMIHPIHQLNQVEPYTIIIDEIDHIPTDEEIGEIVTKESLPTTISHIHSFISIAVSKDAFIKMHARDEIEHLYMTWKEKYYRLTIHEGTQFDEDWPETSNLFSRKIKGLKPNGEVL